MNRLQGTKIQKNTNLKLKIMKKEVNDSTSYESYKERLKTLIDIIKETNEVSYNTELRLYFLLCDTYYKTF